MAEEGRCSGKLEISYMPKGIDGQSCAEAIRASLKPGEVVAFAELFRRVSKQGDWKESTIYQHLMSCVVNLPPARHHWKSTIPFLLIHPDGRYELYDAAKHPRTIE